MMLSLGTILYLLARALPRVNDQEIKEKSASSQPHWFNTYLEKADEWLKAYLEKFLRRIRVWILKLDNFVAHRLNRFKKETPREPILPIEGKSVNVQGESSDIESSDRTA